MNSVIIFIINLYKKYLSPVLIQVLGAGCRFSPTCSEYTIQAFEKHNTLKAGVLSIKRIIKCNPFSSCRFDPVP